MMPVLNGRHDHVKVYRLRGTRYAEGRGSTVMEAVEMTREMFYGEFGFYPRKESTVIEVVGITVGRCATILEIKEDI